MGAIFGFLGSLIGSLIVAGIPVVWAIYKKQDNAKAITTVTVITFIAGFVVSLVLGFLSSLLAFLGILGSIWGILTLAITVYMYYCAFANKPLELLEKLGIKLNF